MSDSSNEVTTQMKLSVCVVTYNQQNFIAECLNSIVSQKTHFDFEVLVADDGSTDKTRDIILNFAERYPFIKPIFHDKNIGALKNFAFVHQYAQGEYIAHVDGDDVLIQGKLSSQVEYLDLNPGISMATHAVNIMGSNVNIGDEPYLPIIGDVYDILRFGTYFVNSSTMYRKSFSFEHEKDFETVDFYFYVERAIKGNIYLDKRVFGKYRDHGAGISKVSSYREKIENCYQNAYFRAIELGVPRRVVLCEYLKRRKTFAYNRYFLGDKDGYKKMIEINKDYLQYASKFHRVLSASKNYPIYIWLFKVLRKLKKSILSIKTMD